MSKRDKEMKSLFGSTLVVGIIIFLVVFLVAFKMFDLSVVDVNKPEVDIDKLADQSITAMVYAIDKSKENIVLFDYKKNKKISDEYSFNATTKVYDVDSQLSSISELHPGEIVEINYVEETNLISKIRITNKHWEVPRLENIDLDVAHNIVTANKKTYNLYKDCVFTYKDNYVTYKEFSSPAICTLRGFGDNVYGIEILEYMGYIRFEYPDTLDNADVSIDSNKIVKINDLPDEPLAPGDRQVLITKQGVDEILLTVNVAEGETTVLDIVDNVNIKTCLVTLNVNYEGYYVDIKNSTGSINVRYTDNLEDKTSAKKILNRQIALPYGTYTFTFSKDGFSTFTRKVELNSANKPLTASLAPKGQTQTPTVVDTTPKYTIKICSTVEDTNLYIDGAFYKSTGPNGVSCSLTEGEHTLRFVKSGYETLERVLTVNADTSNSKTYPMEKQNAYENKEENKSSDNDAYKNPGETY